jgi:hypothetical protein
MPLGMNGEAVLRRAPLVMPRHGRSENPKELPLVLLFIDDFTGRPDPRPLEDRKEQRVDLDNFAQTMDRHQPADSAAPAWAALHRALERIGRHEDVSCHVLNVSADDLVADFDDYAPEVRRSGLFKLLHTGCYEGPGGTPFSAAFSAHSLPTGDLPTSRMLAETAARAFTLYFVRGGQATPFVRNDDGSALDRIVATFHELRWCIDRTNDEGTLARLASTLKVLQRSYMAAWRSPTAIEEGLNGWLAAYVGHDRVFREARVGVAAEERECSRRFTLTVQPHGAPRALEVEGLFDTE